MFVNVYYHDHLYRATLGIKQDYVDNVGGLPQLAIVGEEADELDGNDIVRSGVAGHHALKRIEIRFLRASNH